MPGRDLVEWVSDQILLLYTVKLAASKKPPVRTRIQKVLFVAEVKSWEKRVGGLDYAFIKFNHGPYSGELDGDIKRLQKGRFMRIVSPSGGHYLNPNGVELLNEFKPILKRNKEILQLIRESIKIVFAPRFKEMLKKIYDQPNPLNPSITIAETPEKNYLLSRETRHVDLPRFDLTEVEAESLEITLDPQLYRKYLIAEESVRTRPTTHWRDNPIYND